MSIRFLPAAMADLAGIERRLGDRRAAWRKSALRVYREAKALLAAQKGFSPIAGTGNVGRLAIPGTFVIVYYELTPSGITVLRLFDAQAEEQGEAQGETGGGTG